MDATSTTSPPPAPARGERFADPAVAVVWAAVEQLDDDAKHDLLRELREELAVAGTGGGYSGREARAVRALREAEEIVRAQGRNGGLSVERYRELFAIEGRDAGWPPDGSIRRWFGGVSWNDCLRRAGLGTVAGGDVLVAELGWRFTREEISPRCTSTRLPATRYLHHVEPGVNAHRSPRDVDGRSRRRGAERVARGGAAMVAARSSGQGPQPVPGRPLSEPGRR